MYEKTEELASQLTTALRLYWFSVRKSYLISVDSYYFQFQSIRLLSIWTVLVSNVVRIWGIDIPPDTTISANITSKSIRKSEML